jgi:putative inorganic carbon (hco3(-)) transporter
MRERLASPALPVSGAALLAALAGAAVTTRFGPADGFLAFAVTAACLAGVAIAAVVPPAMMISAGLSLEIFSGEFQHLGSPIGIDRVVLVIGILAAVLRDLRAPQRRLQVWRIHLVLAAIAGYAIVSALFDHQLTVNESFFGLVDYLGLIPFALFFVAPAAFPGPAERRILIGSLTVVGLYLGVTSILEITGPHALVLPPYINNPNIGIHWGRARGPFVEAAGNGLSMFICIVASAIALVQWRRRRWLPALSIAVCAIGIVFTLTRQIWLAAAIATIVTMLLQPRLRRWALPLAAVGAAGILVVLIAVPGFQTRASGRLDDKGPVWDRLNSDAAAVRMVEQRPLTGWGWYSFGKESLPFYRLAADRPVTTVGRVHNIFLGYATELGVLPTLVWMGTLAYVVLTGLRRRGPPDLDHWRVGLVAVSIAWLVVANFTPMGYAFDHSALWLWAGICWGRR